MWFSDNKLLVFTDCHHGADATEKKTEKQVRVQLPTYADNVALPAFARRCC